MDILETIVAAKRKEVEKFKPMSSIERFERDGFFWQIANRSLVKHLLLPGSTGIIAEFKRKSPSKGWFKTKEMEDADYAAQRPGFRQLYDINMTPTIYLLDKEKRIIGKKLTLLQLNDLLEVKWNAAPSN